MRRTDARIVWSSSCAGSASSKNISWISSRVIGKTVCMLGSLGFVAGGPGRLLGSSDSPSRPAVSRLGVKPTRKGTAWTPAAWFGATRARGAARTPATRPEEPADPSSSQRPERGPVAPSLAMSGRSPPRAVPRDRSVERGDCGRGGVDGPSAPAVHGAGDRSPQTPAQNGEGLPGNPTGVPRQRNGDRIVAVAGSASLSLGEGPRPVYPSSGPAASADRARWGCSPGGRLCGRARAAPARRTCRVSVGAHPAGFRSTSAAPSWSGAGGRGGVPHAMELVSYALLVRAVAAVWL